MRARELGSGVATEVKVREPEATEKDLGTDWPFEEARLGCVKLIISICVLHTSRKQVLLFPQK